MKLDGRRVLAVALGMSTMILACCSDPVGDTAAPSARGGRTSLAVHRAGEAQLLRWAEASASDAGPQASFQGRIGPDEDGCFAATDPEGGVFGLIAPYDTSIESGALAVPGAQAIPLDTEVHLGGGYYTADDLALPDDWPCAYAEYFAYHPGS